ncbi:MAG: redox-sensitive transcriptional activator SoxR [Steroidobacteraceae bacterium]
MKTVSNGRPVELSVGQVAARSGVPVSTLHFYESKGLISSHRSNGNQRRYARDVLRFVAIIKFAQTAGIALSDIKEALSTLPEGRVPDKQDWERMTRAWQRMLSERIAALTSLRDQLDTCIGCGCLSLRDCPLRNTDDKMARTGPGPRLLLDPGLKSRSARPRSGA